MKTIGLFKASYVTFAEKKIYKGVFKGLCWRRGYTSSALPTKDHNLHQWRERFPDVKPQTKTENSGGARDADLPSANLYIAFSFSDSTLSVEQSWTKCYNAPHSAGLVRQKAQDFRWPCTVCEYCFQIRLIARKMHILKTPHKNIIIESCCVNTWFSYFSHCLQINLCILTTFRNRMSVFCVCYSTDMSVHA